MPLLYDLGSGLYHAGIHAARPISPKARRWVEGRRGLWRRMEAKRAALQGCLWMHSASAGEFEQGLPVLEAIKAERPSLPVLLTFFSPSGYEAKQGHPIATHVEYLPADDATDARRFIGLARPRLALWVRYEFWRHWLGGLRDAGVPTHLIAGIFRPGQPFFRWYGGTHRAMLRCFDGLFVQDERSAALLSAIGLHHAVVAGDTRFDRVDAIARLSGPLPIGQAFHRAMDAPVLIAGSTWPADERVLAEAMAGMRGPFRLIVAPHEPSPGALRAAERTLPGPAVRWSALELGMEAPGRMASGGPPGDDPFYARTLMVDRVGLLARLYQHADIAYVGGGFTDGIHSVLEAAAWGRPVVFGPRHRKFLEAQGLIDAGGGFEARDAHGLRAVLDRLMRDRVAREAASAAALGFVRERVGAAQRIARALLPALG
ncbi:MAG: 3-deoxy-D-manno-octulosonic acid transferase [Flavobacteriales bacterium]